VPTVPRPTRSLLAALVSTAADVFATLEAMEFGGRVERARDRYQALAGAVAHT
jgi:hypothetical protein